MEQTFSLEKKNILIVEDDSFLQGLLFKKLSSEGFEVTTVDNGEDAIETTENGKFDLILLDLILPRMGGFEVLENLKESSKTRSIPVVILSNLGQKEEIDKGMNLGAEDYMVKAHFTPSEIVEKVISLLKKDREDENNSK